MSQKNAGDIRYRSGIETDGFRRDARTLEREADNTGRRVEQRMRRAGESMQRAGKKLTRRVTLPIVALGTAITKTSTDFETSMSQIVGLVGVSQDQVSEWSRELIKLGPELGKSPRELADALFFVTSAGLEGKDAMEALTMSAKASAAGLGETKVVADLVTSAVNAYGSETTNAAQATDILTAAVREGKLEPAELSQSMGQVLPVASAMGVTFDQVGAAMASMSRTGTNASTAATQLRQIMLSLLKPAAEAQDTLEEMGLSAGGLRKQIREEGLLATLESLTDAFGDNEEAQAKVFGNVRALSGVMDMMGANVDGTREIFDSLADSTGALDHAFETTQKTAGFKFQQAMAKIQALMLDLGDTVMPMVVDIVERLAGVLEGAAERWDNMSEQQKKNVVQALALAAALGPVLVIAGSLVKTLAAVKIAFAGKAVATGAATKAMGGFAALAGAKFIGAAGVLALMAVGFKKVSDNVAESRANVQRLEKMQEDYHREVLDNHTSIMNVKDHQTAASERVAEAENAVNDLMEVRDRLNQQRIERQKIVTQAEEDFNKAVEENGVLSREAREAAKLLDRRRQALGETDEKLTTIQDKLNKAHGTGKIRQDELEEATRLLTKALEGGEEAVKNSMVIWSEFGDAISFEIDDASSQWAGLKRDLEAGINVGALKFEGGPGLNNVPGLSGWFAKGGRPEPGRPAVVGEEGPELFVPDTSGTVIPANQTKDLMNGGSNLNRFTGSGMTTSEIINNIGEINIDSEVDGEAWLKRLTKNQEITSSRLSPRREL